MSDGVALALALVALAVVLAVAVARPRRVSEAAVALAAAAVLLAVGAIGLSRTGDALRSIGPTVGFLAALLLLADGCRRAGLFTAMGARLATGAQGDQRRLLAGVFVIASLVTIVLGLDATAVLVTPIVIDTARRMRADTKPQVYACAHLANSASLLLPVSNLTNLLAFRASGLSFTRFTLLMFAPTVAAIAVEWVVLRRCAPRGPVRATSLPNRAPSQPPPLPRYALLVLALTLIGFALTSALSVAPVWVAAAGAVAITSGDLVGGRVGIRQLLGSAQPGFLVFVLLLAVIVAAAGEHGLTSAVRSVLPAGGSLGDLLVIAAVAALLANAVNNLPATLILVPVAAPAGAGPVLAVLVGVNVGPNLTEVGSLATLLWRRVLRAEGVELSLSEFVRLGMITVPPALLGATVLLWLALQVM